MLEVHYRLVAGGSRRDLYIYIYIVPLCKKEISRHENLIIPSKIRGWQCVGKAAMSGTQRTDLVSERVGKSSTHRCHAVNKSLTSRLLSLTSYSGPRASADARKGSPVEFGGTQRRSAWRLCKDDRRTSRSAHSFCCKLHRLRLTRAIDTVAL